MSSFPRRVPMGVGGQVLGGVRGLCVGRGGQGSCPAGGLPPAVRWRPALRFRGCFGLAQCSSDSPHVRRGRCFLKRVGAVQGGMVWQGGRCRAGLQCQGVPLRLRRLPAAGRCQGPWSPSISISTPARAKGVSVLRRRGRHRYSTAAPRAILSSLKMVVWPSSPMAPVKAYEIDHRRRRGEGEGCSDERGEISDISSCDGPVALPRKGVVLIARGPTPSAILLAYTRSMGGRRTSLVVQQRTETSGPMRPGGRALPQQRLGRGRWLVRR